MPDLNRPNRRIDARSEITGGGGIIDTGGAVAAPAVPLPPAPTGLTVESSGLERSAVTPTALANLRWRPPPNVAVLKYVIQWAIDAGFTTPSGLDAFGDSGAVGGLPTGRTVWFRIQSINPAGVAGPFSAAISALMPADTIPPDAPSSPVIEWSGRTGDALIKWTGSPSANLKHYRVRVLSGDGLTELHVDVSGSPFYTFSRDQHRRATGGVFQTSIRVRIAAVSWGNIASGEVEATATLSPPAQPTNVRHNWQNDTGTAEADLEFAWDLGTEAAGYELVLDSVARSLALQSIYSYPLSVNRQEHGVNPDPVISWSLRAVNALGQFSTAATGTATNAAPPAVTISISGTVNVLEYTLGANTARDADGYRVRLYKGAGVVATIRTYESWGAIDISGYGDGAYSADVTPYDLFGQPGSVTTSATITLDPISLSEIRAGISYRDDLGTNVDTLKQRLADDSRVAPGISYS